MQGNDQGVLLYTNLGLSLFWYSSASVVEADQLPAGQIYEILSMQQNGQCLPRSCVGGYQGMRPGPQIYSVPKYYTPTISGLGPTVYMWELGS